MGTFSVWHWLIVFVCASFFIVPILSASSQKTLARKPYAIRSVMALAFMYLIGGVDRAANASNPLVLAVFLLSILIAGMLLVLWSVHRIQDIGWSKWWCLLFLIPFAGLLLWLVLLFKAGSQGNLNSIEASDTAIESGQSTSSTAALEETVSKVLTAIAVALFVLLGLVQISATLEGLEYWLGWPWLVLAAISVILAYIPIIGTVAGVVGAVYGWGWPWLWAIGLFVGPWLIWVTISIIGSMVPAIFNRRSQSS